MAFDGHVTAPLTSISQQSDGLGGPCEDSHQPGSKATLSFPGLWLGAGRKQPTRAHRQILSPGHAGNLGGMTSLVPRVTSSMST